MTEEQQRRLALFRPMFARSLTKGTINHCKRIYKAGMIAEALEILSDHLSISERDAELIILEVENDRN